MRAPVEPKVASFTGWGSATAFITWLLTTYVFKNLPPGVANSLPGAIGILIGFLGAYLAPHQARTAETVAAVSHVLGSLGQEQNTMGWTLRDSQPVAAAYDVPDGTHYPPDTDLYPAVVPFQPHISAADLGGRQEDPYSTVIMDHDDR